MIGPRTLGSGSSEDPRLPKADATDPVPGLVTLPISSARCPSATAIRALASRRKIVAVAEVETLNGVAYRFPVDEVPGTEDGRARTVMKV